MADEIIIGEKKDRVPIGLEAVCWKCNKIWNVSLLPLNAKNVKCGVITCGGDVVTPSGKIMSRPIYDEFDSSSPLLEIGDNYGKSKIILLGEE